MVPVMAVGFVIVTMAGLDFNAGTCYYYEQQHCSYN